MTTTICLTKEDIVTTKMGNHFEIKPTGTNLCINLTPDAVDEFIKDIQVLRKMETPAENKLSEEEIKKLRLEIMEESCIVFRFGQRL